MRPGRACCAEPLQNRQPRGSGDRPLEHRTWWRAHPDCKSCDAAPCSTCSRKEYCAIVLIDFATSAITLSGRPWLYDRKVQTGGATRVARAAQVIKSFTVKFPLQLHAAGWRARSTTNTDCERSGIALLLCQTDFIIAGVTTLCMAAAATTSQQRRDLLAGRCFTPEASMEA